MGISTHILDTARGMPARGVPVKLERAAGDAWELVGDGETDVDGRVKALIPDGVALTPNAYRITFDTHAYARKNMLECFFPLVMIVFDVRDSSQHYHVPLLLSPYGYATYRGS
jgi:5-hydroxyisourate hydrolase